MTFNPSFPISSEICLHFRVLLLSNENLLIASSGTKITKFYRIAVFSMSFNCSVSGVVLWMIFEYFWLVVQRSMSP